MGTLERVQPDNLMNLIPALADQARFFFRR